MKLIINNEQTKHKDLYFEESFWLGKRSLTYDGETLKKTGRNTFEYGDEDTTKVAKIKGNQIYGLTINIFEEDITIVRKLTWYEILMSLIILLPCFLFGAVGGLIGGIFFTIYYSFIRDINKLWVKIVLSIELAIIALILSYILAIMVFNTFTFLGLF
jgi:hypothetical protein